MTRLTWGLVVGIAMSLMSGCVMDGALTEDGKAEAAQNLPRAPQQGGLIGVQTVGAAGGVHQKDNNSNAGDDNANANGGNANVNDNGNVNADNGNDNGGNSNANDNANVNGDNGNENGGGPCPDGSFRVRSDFAGDGEGEAEYRLLPDGCERFRCRVDDAPADRTLDVIVDGVVVGQIRTDSRGRGEIELDSEDGTWPVGFPQVDVGDSVQVGGALSGMLTLDCSDDPDSCGNGNMNGNSNGNANG